MHRGIVIPPSTPSARAEFARPTAVDRAIADAPPVPTGAPLPLIDVQVPGSSRALPPIPNQTNPTVRTLPPIPAPSDPTARTLPSIPNQTNPTVRTLPPIPAPSDPTARTLPLIPASTPYALSPSASTPPVSLPPELPSAVVQTLQSVPGANLPVTAPNAGLPPIGPNGVVPNVPRLSRADLPVTAPDAGLPPIGPNGVVPDVPRLSRADLPVTAPDAGLPPIGPNGVVPNVPRLSRADLPVTAPDVGLPPIGPNGVAPTLPRLSRADMPITAPDGTLPALARNAEDFEDRMHHGLPDIEYTIDTSRHDIEALPHMRFLALVMGVNSFRLNQAFTGDRVPYRAIRNFERTGRGWKSYEALIKLEIVTAVSVTRDVLRRERRDMCMDDVICIDERTCEQAALATGRVLSALAVTNKLRNPTRNNVFTANLWASSEVRAFISCVRDRRLRPRYGTDMLDDADRYRSFVRIAAGMAGRGPLELFPDLVGISRMPTDWRELRSRLAPEFDAAMVAVVRFVRRFRHDVSEDTLIRDDALRSTCARLLGRFMVMFESDNAAEGTSAVMRYVQSRALALANDEVRIAFGAPVAHHAGVSEYDDYYVR